MASVVPLEVEPTYLWELLMSLGTKWLSAPIGAFFALSGLAFVTPQGALAAPLAAELGPQVTLAVPSGGFVGRLSVAPAHAPVGAPVTVSGQGFPPDQEFDLAWRTVNGSWKAGDGVYLGRDFQPVAYRIAAGQKRQGRDFHRDLHGAGGFRIRARHRAAAGRPAVHPDRVRPRHDREAQIRSRAGRRPDRDRGQRHRVAGAARELDAAVRQRLYGLDVVDHHPWYGALHDSCDRPGRDRISWRC